VEERPIPLAILAGSDLRPGSLPPGSPELHPLAAYKALAIRVAGRPILELLVERLRASAAFDPIAVAGPARVYAGLVRGIRFVDTDADVATNLRAAVDDFLRLRAEGPLAIMACDVLPSARELRALAADFHARAPCAAWFPLVRAPREIGAFGWKPRYGIAPERGAEPERVLPGHLVIADPRALRLPLLYRLLGIAYRTRNRPVETRRRAMLRAVLLELVKQDLRNLLRLRVPDLTWKVVTSGLAVARQVRAGSIVRAELEHHITRILVRAAHRRRHPERGVRLPVVDALGIAEDVDTEEEAAELARAQDERAVRGSEG
jgi:hypothetical protein